MQSVQIKLGAGPDVSQEFNDVKKVKLASSSPCIDVTVWGEDQSPVVIYIDIGQVYFEDNDKGPIFIILMDDQSKALSEQLLIGEPKANTILRFQVPKKSLTDPKNPPKEVPRIELSGNGSGTTWHLERVVIENTAAPCITVFPYHKEIKKDPIVIGREMNKLQGFDFEHSKETADELQKTQKMYRFAEYENDPSLPAEAAEVPTEEGFSLAKTVHEGVILGKLLVVKEIKHLLEWNNSWKSLQDLQSVYTSVDQIFHLPPGAGTWFKDRHFGYQRVNGLNHSFIERCEQIPQKLPVTDSMLKDHLDGLTIQQAIDSKRLFIVDLELLTGIPTQKGRILCAPIGLFFSKNQDELLPVAIQLFQKPGPNNPVFLPEPEDSMRWRLVKMWFNNADAAYHQSVAHLGMTHLLMEGVVVTTHRQLSAKHPIFKLLAPHFLYNIQVNDHAKTTLLGKKGYVTTSMTAGADGTMELTRRALKLWRMDLQGTLPEDLKRRGLEDPDVLPSYHFRDDALLLYNAILKYVTEYTALYYESPDILKTDIQIQAWAAELVKPRNNQDGGCGLQGVPGNGRLDTIDQLVTILTSVIFTCSVQHASVNFAQYDEYGFPVNYPAILYGQPPSSTGDEISEKDILSALPKPFQTLDIMVITSLLSDKYDNKLGYFEHNYITAEDAGSERPLACVVAFKGELQKIQQVMEGRNKERLQPYNNLYPEYVPNAISI